MAFPIDPGRPPGEIRPLELQVPDQGYVGPRVMLPLAPAREQENHDVLLHADLGHEQHDDIAMNLQDMLPLQQIFDLGQQDIMLEDDNDQLREQTGSGRKKDPSIFRNGGRPGAAGISIFGSGITCTGGGSVASSTRIFACRLSNSPVASCQMWYLTLPCLLVQYH